MREINFRVWDNFDKKFLELDDYKELGGIEVENDGTLTLSPRFRFLTSMMIMPERFVPSQYTGLKDKNDKKIYEGDIIIAHDTKFIIKYGEYRTELFDKEYKGTKTKQFGWYAECIDNKEQCNLVVPNGIEIIGNIYEDGNEKDK